MVWQLGSLLCGLTTGTHGGWEIIYTWVPASDGQSQSDTVSEFWSANWSHQLNQGRSHTCGGQGSSSPSAPHRRSRGAKWGPENGIMVKLWVNTAVLCQSVSICLHFPLTLTDFQPFWEIKRVIYFSNQVFWFFIPSSALF